MLGLLSTWDALLLSPLSTDATFMFEELEGVFCGLTIGKGVVTTLVLELDC